MKKLSFNIGTFKPGWKWSKDIKPIVNTDLCMHAHLGVSLTGGCMKVIFKGKESTLSNEELFFLPPGHEAYVEGNSDVTLFDFGSLLTYGKEQKK